MSYAYHPLNDLLSGKFVYDIHCVKEHGYVDVVVPSHNNIDMTMTNREQFAVILINNDLSYIYHPLGNSSSR